MSERLLGAVVGVHGDDYGLILPPSMAPHQVVLIPVAAHSAPEVATRASELAGELRAAGIRVHVDDRDLRPGQKFYDWEIRGVPLRLELGPRDLEAGTVVAAQRTGGKQAVPLVGIVDAVKGQLGAVADELRARAEGYQSQCIRQLPELSESGTGEWHLTSPLEDGVIYEVAFCGSDSAAEILEKTTGLTILGRTLESYPEPRPCAVTGEMTTQRQHLARMY